MKYLTIPQVSTQSDNKHRSYRRKHTYTGHTGRRVFYSRVRSTVGFLFSLFFDWNKNTVIFFVVYIVCFIWVQKNSVPLFVFFSIFNFILWHCNCSSLFSLYASLHARSFSFWNIYVYIYFKCTLAVLPYSWHSIAFCFVLHCSL